VWDTLYAVNCRGTFLMTQAAARAMIAAGGGGRIINFSSAASLRGSPGAAAYASSRAAVEAFSRVAGDRARAARHSRQHDQSGLDRYATDAAPRRRCSRSSPREYRHFRSRVQARRRRWRTSVLFVASDECSYLNGSIIHVDGGASIGARFEGNVVDDDPRYDWVTRALTTRAEGARFAARGSYGQRARREPILARHDHLGACVVRIQRSLLSRRPSSVVRSPSRSSRSRV
jgi:hypothetical protein